MGLDKFLDDAEDVKVIKKDYKSKVDKQLKNKMEDENNFSLNLLNMEKEEESEKVQISIYFEKEDAELLKAVSYLKNTSLNKTVLNIMKPVLESTRGSLDADFDAKALAKKYDNKRTKRRK